MVEVVNNSTQNISVGGTAQLGNVKIETGCTAVYDDNSIILQRAGMYLVYVNGTIGGTAPIELSIVDSNTGIVENGGKVTVGGLSSTTVNTFPFSFEVLVQVKPSCCAVNNNKVLVLNNTGSSIVTLSRVNTIVTKLA